MSMERRRKLASLIHFVIEEIQNGEEKWMRAVCGGDEEVLEELLERLELKPDLSLADLKIAAALYKPIIAFSADPARLECAIDAWEAALPFAKAYLDAGDEDARCIPPYNCMQ